MSAVGAVVLYGTSLAHQVRGGEREPVSSKYMLPLLHWTVWASSVVSLVHDNMEIINTIQMSIAVYGLY